MSYGICGWGSYIPTFRIKVEEIAKIWGQDAASIKKGLNIIEKSVPGMDEDSATMAVEASREALSYVKIDPKKIGAIYFGSESHPYAVKPTGTIVGEAMSCSPNFTTADLEFACKAGTAALHIALAMVRSGMVSYALAGGVDTAQGAPGDPLEYTAAAGGASFIIGKEKVVAEIGAVSSFTTDTPDFWRRDHMTYPNHGGAFTGTPAYFKHIIGAAKMLFKKMGTNPSDYDYAVFHQPNGKFPMRVSKMLGFNEKQLSQGLLVPMIGNTYSASSLLGLCSVLDVAMPGQRIIMVSYGSGAGSDAFDITVTDEMLDYRKKNLPLDLKMKEKVYLTYAEYAKYRKKYVLR